MAVGQKSHWPFQPSEKGEEFNSDHSFCISTSRKSSGTFLPAQACSWAAIPSSQRPGSWAGSVGSRISVLHTDSSLKEQGACLAFNLIDCCARPSMACCEVPGLGWRGRQKPWHSKVQPRLQWEGARGEVIYPLGSCHLISPVTTDPHGHVWQENCCSLPKKLQSFLWNSRGYRQV